VRKAIALLAAIGGGVLIAWIAGSRALSGEALVTNWPARDFARQFPDRDENESATRLLATVERFGDDLGKSRPALSDYIRHGGTPPPFLQQHANTIRTLRAQIVSNPPPVWSLQINDILEPPTPPFGTAMQLFTLFGADAIAQRNELAAWTDLRAAWILARSLWDRPEPMSVMIAMSGTRVVAAVAARLQPPIPAWWNDTAAFEVRLPLLRSIEYEAWATRVRAERYPVGESDGSRFDDTIRRVVAPVFRPIRAAQASIAIGRLQKTAAASAHADPCEPFVIAEAPDWAAFVRRFNRFRIEREGVDKFLTRNFSPSSQCKSGRWTYDGAMLTFHGTLPPQTSRMTVIPLTYRTRPPGG
jgi:hypothetical protein